MCVLASGLFLFLWLCLCLLSLFLSLALTRVTIPSPPLLTLHNAPAWALIVRRLTRVVDCICRRFRFRFHFQEGIVGLKSGVTGRWLGQTFLGYLRVSGTKFGKNFEWQVRFVTEEQKGASVYVLS